MASEDTEITLGAGKLLGLFFLLVAICGVFFAIGYSLGKTSAREQALNDRPAAEPATTTMTGDNGPKPSAAFAHKVEPASAVQGEAAADSHTDLTFYKAVKQNGAETSSSNADSKGSAAPSNTLPTNQADPRAAHNPVAPDWAAAGQSPSPTPKPAELKPVAATLPASGSYVVQVAAVSREEDAVALAGALRKKSYSVYVVNNPAVQDRLYHVQVGPFASLQDAETMKTRLRGEGYNPIVKH